MILERKICKICDCKYLCEYLADRTYPDRFDCEDIRDLVINIIENNINDESEEQK